MHITFIVCIFVVDKRGKVLQNTHTNLNIMRTTHTHTIDLLNTNGNAFVRITKKNRNVFYVNEYIGHESFGIHMDNDKLAEYVYSKFASNWRANLIINLLIVGKDYEHAGNIADCYKVVG